MATRIIYPTLENHQRKWLIYNVDKNLNDDWLVRLNNLTLFYVTNVCEGHHTCLDEYPRIALMCKTNFVIQLERLFVDREMIFSVLSSIIAPDTLFEFSHTTDVSNDPHSKSNCSAFTPIKLSLTRKNPRTSLIFDEQTSSWFDASVSALEYIDMVLFAKCSRC